MHIGVASNQLLDEACPIYQYATSFNFSMIQVTPGSMNVQPCTSVERMFIVVCLDSGMLIHLHSCGQCLKEALVGGEGFADTYTALPGSESTYSNQLPPSGGNWAECVDSRRYSRHSAYPDI